MHGSASPQGEARCEAPPRRSAATAAEGGLPVGVGGSDVTKPDHAGSSSRPRKTATASDSNSARGRVGLQAGVRPVYIALKLVVIGAFVQLAKCLECLFGFRQLFTHGVGLDVFG